MYTYVEDFAILGDEVDDVVRERVLARPSRVRHQVVVVHKVVTTKCYKDKGSVDEAFSLIRSD